MAADRIHQLTVYTIFKHTGDRKVSEVVWTQIVKAGDSSRGPQKNALQFKAAQFDTTRSDIVRDRRDTISQFRLRIPGNLFGQFLLFLLGEDLARTPALDRECKIVIADLFPLVACLEHLGEQIDFVIDAGVASGAFPWPLHLAINDDKNFVSALM
jgi:hypothetical protein